MDNNELDIKACTEYKRDVGMATIDKFFDMFSYPTADIDTQPIREKSKELYAAFLRMTVGKYSGRRPRIPAAACIYLMAIHMGHHVTQDQIRKILSVSAVSISQWYRIVLHETRDDYPELQDTILI